MKIGLKQRQFDFSIIKKTNTSISLSPKKYLYIQYCQWITKNQFNNEKRIMWAEHIYIEIIIIQHGKIDVTLGNTLISERMKHG